MGTDVSAAVSSGREIVLEGVGKTYGEGASAVQALRLVSLTIERGELVVVLGPSGSGKTTLLNLIGALERPSAGTLTVAGRELSALDDGERTSFRCDKRQTNAEIAATLFLSQKTVRNYVSAIFAKLRVADRAEAGLVARAAGLGEPPVAER